MEQIKKLLKLDEKRYYETHLALLNCILPVKMTQSEMEVLAAFMSLEGDIALLRFGPTARKIVMNKLKISPAGLSNFIGQLLKKGFLVKQSDLIEILPILIPEKDKQFYSFKLENIEYGKANTEFTG